MDYKEQNINFLTALASEIVYKFHEEWEPLPNSRVLKYNLVCDKK